MFSRILIFEQKDPLFAILINRAATAYVIESFISSLGAIHAGNPSDEFFLTYTYRCVLYASWPVVQAAIAEDSQHIFPDYLEIISVSEYEPVANFRQISIIYVRLHCETYATFECVRM